MKGDTLDPKALIREAFRIDGIVIEECRAIFLDWALGVPDGSDMQALIGQLRAQYQREPEDHPMHMVLLEGLGKVAQGDQNKGRKGGRAARIGRGS